ncbi:phage portal protein [Leadbettera azotonutricia]|uniref:Phage portal protein, HK97 family n=1 Tax=Leadbettera azotonutricia (strain ATCC BAA-888 / DSM 13862 / ZAS-9) TaxID=545695 RepID=F5Y7K9_LEAAZ|nr:phage portal protein [Leadbettera azotonutricia]AEF81071.1 phage portal protein, HK97 family [Leadbettera azotonutricia ZAS-9]
MKLFTPLINGIKTLKLQTKADRPDYPMDDEFQNNLPILSESGAYLYSAWVNIAVGILIRNIARAEFGLIRGGNDVTSGPLFELFRRPNRLMSGYDLWKETAAWWYLEGEAFWWFGPDYDGGLPHEIYILDPRRVRHESVTAGGVHDPFNQLKKRWFYQTDTDLIPILTDELIQFRDWNPWNPIRGVNPLAALALELEQDYYANKANSQLLKNNAIPMGILKTDQTIRPEEADALERRWESKYGAVKANRKIAVLGKGTSFEPLSFTPEVVKLFELKRWNLYTILAKYGIPPRVANINDKSSNLSGKDTAEQHSAFWQYTLIPTLRQFENILETQFFICFGLRETGKFNLGDIPELQESEDAQSNRDIAEINAGLKTINDVLKERGKETKPWGDKWYRPKNLVPVNVQSGDTSGEGHGE